MAEAALMSLTAPAPALNPPNQNRTTPASNLRPPTPNSPSTSPCPSLSRPLLQEPVKGQNPHLQNLIRPGRETLRPQRPATAWSWAATTIPSSWATASTAGLLETHTGTKQANNLLGEHLHIALSSELEDAHKTIEALENVNVPCLIKELLQKHLNPSGAKQKTVTSPVPAGRSAATPAGSLSQALKAEDPAQKWLMGPEAGPPRVTAFTPVKQGVPQSRNDHIQRESDRSPPFTLEDLSADIYRKISARYAARPQPLYAQSLSSNASETPPNLQQTHAGVDSWAGKGGMQVTFLEEDVADVTSTSAQKILEEFLRQLQPHQEVPEGEEERSRREKMAAEKHTEQGAG
ncbi:unnamed protein product [Tetraodon nigroviridis]|uniref:(spotted green pufferfish) hypothetical protein n=1 Tax=Tetraodon nigroviridis TaxID=99883 RepID=Q4RPC3_TETNG|nr:unnamed protein product [Tetraodon nigroviridis]